MSGQKFIARNPAPRVNVEYSVELYGALKAVQLPFVVGVMADLAGQRREPLARIDDRKFLEVTSDNLDDRMKVLQPRVAFQVANTLAGAGTRDVDVVFESMDDFSPSAIVRKIGPLEALADSRQRLSNLVTYLDGKTEAERLTGELLRIPRGWLRWRVPVAGAWTRPSPPW